jgi:DNA-binding NtrC family response regulator
MSNRKLRSGLRVLIVEDEMIVAWALADMLTRIGCVVVGRAARVNQALAMIAAEAIDVALLDINLNGEKCFPVADALAKLAVPFVFSTAYHNENLPDAYQCAPMLQKPFDASTLANMLAKLLMKAVPEMSERL